MEQPEVTETLAARLDGGDALTPAAPAPRPAADVLAPRACATCGAAPATNGAAAATAAAPVFVYAIGRIEPRFPRPDVEKEFAQAIGRAETAGLRTGRRPGTFCRNGRIATSHVSCAG